MYIYIYIERERERQNPPERCERDTDPDAASFEEQPAYVKHAIYVYMCVCLSVCICICVYIYIYICIYTHSCLYVYVLIVTSSLFFSGTWQKRSASAGGISRARFLLILLRSFCADSSSPQISAIHFSRFAMELAVILQYVITI